MKIKQVVIHGEGKVSLDDAEIPDATPPGEILVETEATFISAGTELSGYQGLNPGRPMPGPPEYPLTPGYLNVGRVLAAGDDVGEFRAANIENLMRALSEQIPGEIVGHRFEFYVNCETCLRN